MRLRSCLVIARNELRVLRTDPTPLILVIGMPLIVVAILRSAMRAALTLAGYHGASGSDFEVPAQIVTFVFFIPAFTAISFFREHGWGTWDRLRAGPASATEITLGKLIPSLGLGVLQLAVVLGLGVLFLGLDIRGSAAGLVLLALALITCVGCLGLAMTALCRTVQQVNALANAGSVGLAAIGGALVPLFTLPVWIQHIAPVTPQYWAMRGFNAVILQGRGLGSVWLSVLVLLGFSAGFSGLALMRFRFGDRKLGWA